MPARLPGQSLLDYLWVNFGEHYVSDTLEENGIPSSKLLLELVNNVANSAINNLRVVDDQLIGYNKEGGEVFSMNVSEISNEKTVVAFGKRYITQEDIDKGCVYSKGTPVYSLLFSDDSELVAKIDEYQGEMTNSVAVDVNEHFISARLRVDNETSVVPIKETRNGVLADLNISPNVESIEFVKEFEGLKARILLDNEGKTLKFKHLTLTEYLEIEEPDPTTVYFLHGKKYFYFGRYLIGVTEDFLVDYYTKEETDAELDEINDTLNKINNVLYDTMDVGNAVLVNRRTLEKVSVPPYQLNKYAPEEWEPIGVVVIPTSHDVYGTGEAGVMALKSGSCEEPDTGSIIEKDASYGAYGNDYPELPTYKNVNSIVSRNPNNIIRPCTNLLHPKLPSDYFGGSLSLDGISKYSLVYDMSTANIVSPYNSDGSRNEAYYAKGPITPIDPIYGLAEYTVDGLNIKWENKTNAWHSRDNNEAIDKREYYSGYIANGGQAIVRCFFSGKKGRITFACKSNGEAGLDYLTVGELDRLCNKTQYRESFKDKVNNQYYNITYDIPDEDLHFVEFCYTKYGSINLSDDCATVYILGGTTNIAIKPGLIGEGAINNALSDFSGKTTTEFLCSKATALTDWKTANIIENNTSENPSESAGYHPAACACWRYHTIGTEQGDWFLPACGELGYACVRKKVIRNTIELLQNYFNISLCQLPYNNILWSCSKYDAYTSWGISFYDGWLFTLSKNDGHSVRPFTRLKLTPPLSFYTRPEVDKRLVPLEEASNRSLITFVVQDSVTNVESDITIYSNGTHTVYDREEYTDYDYGYNEIDLYGQWDIDET